MGNIGFNLAMLRPHHPLFQSAADAPVSPGGSSFPLNFNENTTTISVDGEGFKDVGDAAFGSPSEIAAQVAAPAPATPAVPLAEAPVPAVLQPTPAPAPAAPAPVAAVDAVSRMAEAMRSVYPDATPAEIAQRVADAMRPAEQEPAVVEEADPEVTQLENVETQLEALRQQARDEGTSDLDEQIRELEFERVKLSTKMEMRQEANQEREIEAFAIEANGWDDEAGRAYPAADQPGHPLSAAVQARVAAIKSQDPDFFIRSPDAGFSLVATEAAKLGIPPIPKPTGTAPSPHQPVPIAAPVAMSGHVQSSHRPAETPPVDETVAFFQRMADAEKTGSLAAMISASRTFAPGGTVHSGVAFKS